MVINTTTVRFRISSICKAYMSFWSLHIPVGFICMNIASKHKFHAYGLPRNSTAQLAVVNEFHSTSTKVQRTVGFWRNGLRQRFLMAGSVLCVCVCVCVCVCFVCVCGVCVCVCVCVCGVCLCVCVFCVCVVCVCLADVACTVGLWIFCCFMHSLCSVHRRLVDMLPVRSITQCH